MTDKKKDTIVIHEEKLPAQGTPDALLTLAITNNLDIEKLQKLMEMKKDWEDRLAKKAFFSALSLFQSKCPVIKKNETVKFENRAGGKTSYSFAPLSEIEKQIKDPMHECGLSRSYRIDDFTNPEKITVFCRIAHVDGYSEETPMSAAKDNSGGKNEIQMRGSTITYLERYTLLAALGLTTADEDNDGQSAGDKRASSEQSSPEPTEWLNEGSDAWKEAERRIKVDGVPSLEVLKELRTQWKVNKKCSEAIIAMKKGDNAAPAADKQTPAAEKQPAATGKAKPKIVSADKDEWNKLNDEPFFDFKTASPKMKAYNNNVVKLSSGEVALKTVTDAYDLDEDVLLHYTAIAKRKE